MAVLKVATCQFPVSRDIEQNAGWITQLVRTPGNAPVRYETVLVSLAQHVLGEQWERLRHLWPGARRR